MKTKRRTVLQRTVAFAAAIVIAATGALTGGTRAAAETSTIADIFNILKEHGLDGSNLILTALGELGLVGGGPTLEEIEEIVNNAVTELKTALTAHEAAIRSHINAITVSELRSCAEVAMDNFLIIDQLTEDNLQAQALLAKSCYTRIENLIYDFTPLDGQPADPVNGPMLHSLGMILADLESWVEKWMMKAGLTGTGPRGLHWRRPHRPCRASWP